MSQPTNTVTKVLEPGQDKKRLLHNATFAIIQVIFSSVILFLLYRYLVNQLGVEALGVWTLVVAATSLANIGNLGISGGIVRFVSQYLAKNDSKGAASAVETGIVSLVFLVSVICLCLWPSIYWGLRWIIPLPWLAEAKALLPYSILALLFSVLGGGIHSALEGCHRSDLRSISTMLCQPLLLIGAVMLSPTFGLKGVALAQIGQYVVWIVIGWVLLKRQLSSLSIIPFRWSKKQFLEMWRYGVNIQIVLILVLMSEPMAKALLAYHTNLNSVAYFEMANRVVMQVRGLLTSANQVITPFYAKLQAIDTTKISHIYLRNVQLMALLGSALFATITAFGPMLSVLWIGHLEMQFLVFLCILSVGWFANVLCTPAYFANLGIAHLGPNVRGHFVIMLSIIVVGVSLGSWLRPYGSALAWPVGLLMGSIVINRGFHAHIQLPYRHWMRNLKISRVLLNLAVGFVTFIASLYFLQVNQAGGMVRAFLCVASALVIIVLLNTPRVLMLIQLKKPILPK